MKSHSLIPTLCVLALGFACAGCLSSGSGASTPRYTVADTAGELKVAGARPEVRLQSDIRAYNVPLRFNADGSVTPCAGIRYYAPLELAMTRALRDITQEDASARPRKVLIEAFGVDARGAQPIAHVALRFANGEVIRKESPIDPSLPPAELRKTLGKLLLEAYRTACTH